MKGGRSRQRKSATREVADWWNGVESVGGGACVDDGATIVSHPDLEGDGEGDAWLNGVGPLGA